jgi:lipoate-protein ligase A
LRDEKYKTWEFVYGASPPCNLIKKAQFDWGNVKVHLNVKKGLIENCMIYGDFFAGDDVVELASQLCGVKYQEDCIRERLEIVDLKRYLRRLNGKKSSSCFRSSFLRNEGLL